MRLGRHEESLDALAEAVKLEPELAVAWYNKACAYGQLGRKAEMLDALKRAVESDPALTDAVSADPDFEPFRDDPEFQELIG